MLSHICTQLYASPCGTLLVGSHADKLCMCDWTDGNNHQSVIQRLKRLLNAGIIEQSSHITETAIRQLDEYFSHSRQAFDIPLYFAGTDFQQTVWNALLTIPYGTTISYADLSRRIGMPTAVRAVANANAANAISIFAPCHRVIGADASLTGYGGGLRAKRYLLELEMPCLVTLSQL